MQDILKIVEIQTKREFHNKLENKLRQLQNNEIKLEDWLDEVFEKNRKINREYYKIEAEAEKRKSEKIDWKLLNEQIFQKNDSPNQLKLPFQILEERKVETKYAIFSGSESEVRMKVSTFLSENKGIRIISQSTIGINYGNVTTIKLSLFYEI